MDQITRFIARTSMGCEQITLANITGQRVDISLGFRKMISTTHTLVRTDVYHNILRDMREIDSVTQHKPRYRKEWTER